MASSRLTGTNENVSTGGDVSRDYNLTAGEMTTWEGDTDRELASENVSEVLEIYDDAEFDFNDIQLNGAISDASYFRIIRPTSGAEHKGIMDDGIIIKPTAMTTYLFYINESHTSVQDITVKTGSLPTGATCYALYLSPFDDTSFAGCIVDGEEQESVTGTRVGFYLKGSTAAAPPVAINCLAINLSSTGICAGFRSSSSAANNEHEIISSGAHNCDVGLERASAITQRIINCDFSGNTDDVNGDFSGSNWTTNNPATYNGVAGSPTFVASGSDNYHLADADTVLRGNGTDMSGDGVFAFDDDVDFDTRLPWDIGFDENLTVAGGVGKLVNGGLVNAGLVGGRLT